MGGRARIVFGILAAALVCAGSASATPGWTEVTIDGSGSTQLACAYIIPTGTAPAGGWPGVILFHGLGESHIDMELWGTALAKFGFAGLACDARGTGDSGGKFGLDGPKEVEDARDLLNWFAGRAGVSDTKIGALGLSLGGGAVWNAAAAGVPFKAIVPAITWTSLGAGLDPNGVAKTGLLDQLFKLVPGSRWDPSLAQMRDDLLAGHVTAAVKSAEAARSARSALHTLKVPTLMLQGRHDFIFDLDQALATYRLLAGPKRLYLGDLGHDPAKNPAAEQPTYFREVISWFRHYLAGGPNPGGGVQLAHDPWDGKVTSYKRLPRTRHTTVNLPGSKRIAANGSTSRSVRLTGGPLETFGDSSLAVRYSGNPALTEMRVTVSVKGRRAPVTVGAAKLPKGSGVVKIPLLDEAVLLPRGKRLEVTIGAITADGVYLPDLGGDAAIKIGRMTLNLSVLKKTVSR